MKLVYYVLPETSDSNIIVVEKPYVAEGVELEVAVLLDAADNERPLFYFSTEHTDDGTANTEVYEVENIPPSLSVYGNGEVEGVLPFNNINEVKEWLGHLDRKSEELDDLYSV